MGREIWLGTAGSTAPCLCTRSSPIVTGRSTWAALLVSHHRPGFYLRVLAEGVVRSGDDIVKIASGPEGMTVAEIDALLYLPGHPRKELLRALRIPALPDGW